MIILDGGLRFGATLYIFVGLKLLSGQKSLISAKM